MAGSQIPIGRNAGGHGEAGMESEEGTAFESLPRRGVVDLRKASCSLKHKNVIN
jgi:hypothetical protein